MNLFNAETEIDGKKIGLTHPTYFVADVAANHDGDLTRAKELIRLAAAAGADAAKFQHFTAKTIVSDYGFKNLDDQRSHQAEWDKPVFDVYKDASLNCDWTETLRDTCKDAGIAFFTSAYSVELVDKVDEFVPAYKIGSGDITWHEIMDHICTKKKPVLLASGASTNDEVYAAINRIQKRTKDIVLMQCNTNYTGGLENFKYIQLNVLSVYKEMFPGIILGLSDHTPGHATVLGAIALGAKVIEKHFTDDNNRTGPDHKFAMSPESWADMVARSRELESALGNGIKKIEDNEKEAVIIQRRAVCYKSNLKTGKKLALTDLEYLRPCPLDALPPFKVIEVLGRELRKDVVEGEHVKWNDLN